ncbi:ATP-binding protein, partial [Falsiroseomonas selenitidurans]
MNDLPDRPAPATALRHAGWSEAWGALLAALAEGPGVVALLGPPGVGKTMMLGELERRLRQAGPGVHRVDFGDLAGPPAPGVLLVDEAERIGAPALEALARQTAGVAVLAALPGFAQRLQGLAHRRVILRPVRAGEVPAYVAARLAQLGVPSARLAPDGVAALGAASGGVPRLLNMLLGSALFTAGLDGAARVGAAQVQAAAAMLTLPKPQRGAPRPAPALASPPASAHPATARPAPAQARPWLLGGL